jgi:phosphatidylinositol alpha-mannosyltransferase
VRIGIVCPYDIGAPGGVQQLTGELGAHLLANGDEVVFVGAGKNWFHGGPGLDEKTFYAGRAISLRANRSKAPVTLSPLSWPGVRRALATVDVVHVHEPLVPLVGWMGLSANKPMVVTFHADPPRWVTRLYRMIPGLGRRLRRSTITAVSQVAARSLPPSWGQVRIVPNAIDVASYAPSVDRENHRVAFLGRDDPRKGLSLLLGAWPAVRSAIPDAELIVMGASRKETQPGVEYLGPISGKEKKRLLASSQVYVAPNLGGESFGIVVVEGMAAGCAVVSSDIPAFTEVGGDATVRVPAWPRC